MELTDRRIIPAPVEAVWAATLDVESWPDDTPTITSVRRLDEGDLRPGSRAEVRQPGQRPTVWTVTTVDHEAHRFQWQATVYGMRTTATHHVETVDGGCANTLTLQMEGGPVRVLGPVLRRRLQKVLATENLGFEHAASARSAAS